MRDGRLRLGKLTAKQLTPSRRQGHDEFIVRLVATGRGLVHGAGNDLAGGLADR